MTSTTIYKRGRVVVVEVPFTDGTGGKRRPVLVLSEESFHRQLPDVILCPISSQPRYYQHPGPGDHPLQHWATAGLRHPSTARISHVMAVDKSLIQRQLGMLPADDLRAVERLLRRAFGL
jgi:mRNA interferase MazF